MRQGYVSDLTDAQWDLVRPLVEAQTGRKASIDRRHIVNAILYVAHTGCQWRQLPNDLPIWSTVYSCYHRWTWNGVLEALHDALREQSREAKGKKGTPSAAIVDSQSVKVTSKGGCRVCSNADTTAPNA